MAGSTPIYGFPYPQSTDLVADYPALGQELATDVETVISGLGSGLNLVSATSIANSGGSAVRTGGQVTFTGVSSVTLNGVFSSTYENYRIVFISTQSAAVSLSTRLCVSGTPDTNSNYAYAIYEYTTSNVAQGVTFSAGATSFVTGNYGVNGSVGDYTLYRPQAAAHTLMSGTTSTSDTAPVSAFRGIGGAYKAATQFDGIQFFPSSGTITGTVRVYGYKNS